MDNVLEQAVLKAKLVRTRGRLTRLALFDAFFLPAAVILIFALVVVTGAISAVPAGLRALLIWGFWLAFAATMVRAWSRFRLPTHAEVQEALDATDPERPLSALSDHPASYNEKTQAYWAKHRAHLTDRVQHLHPPTLTAEWKKRDPFWLRFAAPLVLIGLVALNFSVLPQRFSTMLHPDLGALFGADELKVSAWLTPPEHTGEAPVFLASEGGEVLVPAGSTLTFRVHGRAAPVLKRQALEKGARLKGPKAIRLRKFLDGARQAEFQLYTPQTLSLKAWGVRGSWVVNVAEDRVPNVIWLAAPAPDEVDKLTFRWGADDDYGLASANLRITTIEGAGVPGGQIDRVTLDLPSYQPVVEASAHLDLVRHKWAGLQVLMAVEVTDSAGQTAVSSEVEYKLPEKLLLEAMAKSSQEIRLELLREDGAYAALPEEVTDTNGAFNGLGDRLEAAPDRVRRAAMMLDVLTYRPDIFAEDLSVYLGLRQALERIRGARQSEDLADLDDLLWAVTLRSEYGTLADAARRLEAARRALERALREGASEAEIRRLMQAFRDAAEDYIAARMADAMLNGRQGQSGGQSGQSNALQGQDLEDMLAALEDLTETGATDAARQLLEDVANLLNNLEFQMGQSGGDGMPVGEGEQGEAEEQTSEEEQALQGALDKLSELMEDQRRLNDDTLQQENGSGGNFDQGMTGAQEDPNAENGMSDGELGDGEDSMGANGEQSPGALADRQFDILEDLQGFSNELGEDTGSASGLTAEEFEKARRALERAGNALRRGDLDAAQWNQDRAIEEMRDAATDLAEALDARRAQRLGENDQDTNHEEDPLGRPVGGAQSNDADGIVIPDEIERQRARDILDDLRERLSKSEDPEEREYLERLLDRFGGS